MSELAKLQQQIKETNDLIKALTLDIQDIKSQLMYAAKKPIAKGGLPSKVAVEALFTQEQKSIMDIQDRDNYFYIKLTEYVNDKQAFGDIAKRVKGVGGEYVSAGKESHFRVPKKA